MKDLQAVLDKLKTLGGELSKFATKLDSGENNLVKVSSKVDTIEGWMRKTDEAIGKVEDLIKRQAGNILPGFEDEIAKNGAVNPIRALFDKKSRDFNMILEYTKNRNEERANRGDEVIQRDMSASDDSKGAVFIPAQMLPGYIDKVRERSLLWKATGGPGITVWNNLTGSPVEIPNITQDIVPTIAGELDVPSTTDIGAGMIKFEPRAIKSLTKLTKRLRRMGPLAATVVEKSAQIKFALEIDRVGLRGKGTEKESLGIVNTPGILSVSIGTNGGNFTLATARAMKHKLRQNLALPGSRGFVGHPDAFYTAQVERIPQFSGDTGGAYVMLPMNEQQLAGFIGPWWDTTVFPGNLAKGTATTLCEVIYGNWEDFWLAIWEDLTFSVTDQAGDSFEKSQVWIKVEMEYDLQVVRPLSFVLANDANTVSL